VIEQAPAPSSPSQPSAVHVARGASYFMIQNLTTSAAQIVSFAILARLITTKEMGILAVLNLVSAACAAFGTISLQQAATKYVAETYTEGRAEAAGVFYQSIRTTFIVAALIAASVFLASSLLAVQMVGALNYAIYFQVLAFDIVISTGLNPVLSSTMLGLQKFREAAGIGILGTLIRQSLIITLIVILRSFLGLAIAWVLSDLVLAAAYGAYLLRHLGAPRFNFPLRKLIDYSWPLVVSSGVGYVYSYFDSAVLLALVPLATLGVYNATLQAFNALAGVSNAISATLFPAYSAIQNGKQRESSSGAVRLAARYVYLIVVPLALGLFATAKPALSLFVGRAYVTGSNPLMILTGSFSVTVIGIVLGPMLLARGHTRASSAITAASVFVSIGTALILVPTWGMIGASTARALGMIASTALIILFLRRRLSLRLDVATLVKALTASVVMTAVVMAVQIRLYSPYLLPLYIVIGAVTYFTALRLLKAVKEEDIDLIRRYFGPRLSFVPRMLSWILLPTVKRSIRQRGG
jgi:O-antigen/teichoic acid export membrane protein